MKTLETSLENKVIQNEEAFNKIKFLASQGETIKACDFYRKTLLEMLDINTKGALIEHSSPVEYFVILNKMFGLDIR